MLVRSDNEACYPVVEGVPILLAPEALVTERTAVHPIDTTRDPYKEAYEEMDFYDVWAHKDAQNIKGSDAYRIVERAQVGSRVLSEEWLDSGFDCNAQLDAFRHLEPLDGASTMQLGGKGVQAVKFLVLGARESWLVTPMLREALFARSLAAVFHVEDRFRCVVAIGEELPFEDGYFDRIYSGGCIHHTITEKALPEISRVLQPSGRFAAVEPWKAPLYTIGTKVLGKREVGVNCRPIDAKRVAPLSRSFDASEVIHHGTLTRYPLLALHKFGVRPGMETIRRITTLDDRISSVAPIRKYGSSVALLGTKKAA